MKYTYRTKWIFTMIVKGKYKKFQADILHTPMLIILVVVPNKERNIAVPWEHDMLQG